MKNNVLKRRVIFISLLGSMAVAAEQVEVPFNFVPATTIKSEEMNSNFSTIYSDANEKDITISALETNVLTIDSGIESLQQSTIDNGTTLNSIAEALDSIGGTLISMNTKMNTSLSEVVTDQLICNLHYTYINTGGAFECFQATDPSATKSLTLTEIIQAGWVAKSIGGDGSSRSTMIFHM